MNDYILVAEDINAAYGKKQVLFGVDLKIRKGEIASLIGPNGSGKSTFLKVISGLISPFKGKIYFLGEAITNYPVEKRIKMGIGYFLQGGEVFLNLTVYENLKMGGFELKEKDFKNSLEEVFTLFPLLKKYLNKRAGLLSGGERHALALGIVLMRKPKLLLLDEPSAGLAPVLVKEIIEKIKMIKEKLGTTILLVEQNVKEALKIASVVYLLKNGKVIGEEKPENILEKKLEEIFFR
jgi:branched-chain amino acid transport system ATP-binding protein